MLCRLSQNDRRFPLYPPQPVGGCVGYESEGNSAEQEGSREDAVAAIRFALQTASLRGPVNAVAPQPVTNREFTKTLGRVLSRPTVVPLPAFVARLVFGEMADALLLASTRVRPDRLLASGYEFRHPSFEDALRHELGCGPAALHSA